MVALPTLSWRTFIILVRGLSSNSATVTKLSNARMIGQGKDAVKALTKPEHAQSAFEGLFSHSS